MNRNKDQIICMLFDYDEIVLNGVAADTFDLVRFCEDLHNGKVEIHKMFCKISEGKSCVSINTVV